MTGTGFAISCDGCSLRASALSGPGFDMRFSNVMVACDTCMTIGTVTVRTGNETANPSEMEDEELAQLPQHGDELMCHVCHGPLRHISPIQVPDAWGHKFPGRSQDPVISTPEARCPACSGTLLSSINLFFDWEQTTMSTCSHNLQRFVLAQNGSAPGQYQQGTYSNALHEIASCRKDSHWMWYVFPQIKGLGDSDMAQYYAISCVPEAVEYLEHPVLGSRYVEMLEAVMACLAASGSADLWSRLKAVLGGTDAKKFKSSVTLFSHAANLATGPNAVACIGITQQVFYLGLTSCSSTIASIQQPSCCDRTTPAGA